MLNSFQHLHNRLTGGMDNRFRERIHGRRRPIGSKGRALALLNSWLLAEGHFSNDVECQDLHFTHEALRIHAYLYCSGGPTDKPAALLLHGHTPDTLELAALAKKLAEFGWAAVVLEGRGRGLSEGNAEDVNGYVRDAVTALKYMRILGVDRTRMYVVGQSLGSAVAVLCGVVDQEVAGVVALHAYDEISPDALGGGVEEPDVRRPVDVVHKISPRPLLIIAGEKDNILPCEGAIRLYKAAKDPKRLVILRDGTHALEDSEVYVLGWLVSRV